MLERDLEQVVAVGADAAVVAEGQRSPAPEQLDDHFVEGGHKLRVS